MQRLFKQLVGFGLVGVMATAIDWSIYFTLVNMTRIHYLVANILGFVLSVMFNYWASMTFVFQSKYSKEQKHHEFVVFMILSILGLSLNSVLLYWSVDVASLSENRAKILVAIIVVVFNFITRKIFLDKKR